MDFIHLRQAPFASILFMLLNKLITSSTFFKRKKTFGQDSYCHNACQYSHAMHIFAQTHRCFYPPSSGRIESTMSLYNDMHVLAIIVTTTT